MSLFLRYMSYMLDKVPSNSPQIDLYYKIQAFDLDNPKATIPFSKRLAKENSWCMKYTQKAIEEYKKFIFLKVVSDRPVIASRQIERVWHLHLIYTHSYWNCFCLDVLGKPLHYEPVDGNLNESYQQRENYKQTLIVYRDWFGKQPPANVWFPVDKQFKLPENTIVSRSNIVEIEPKIVSRESRRSQEIAFGF
jgi:hypothetical protein